MSRSPTTDPAFHGQNKHSKQSKVERYDWKVRDQPGESMWLSKSMLHVDHEYQRTTIHAARVHAIARDWSWIALGVLIVAMRADGTYWIIDGQHRKLAADKRADIDELPCLVFRVESIASEAKGFVGSNTVRGPVKAVAVFTANVKAEDPISLLVKEMVENSGYSVGSKGDYRVQCVARLLSCYRGDPAITQDVWGLCVDIHAGLGIIEPLFAGCHYLERVLRRRDDGASLLSRYNRAALHKATPAGLLSTIRKVGELHGCGGAKMWAEGIVVALNKGRRGHKLPSMLNTE